jgi:thiol-disulfide isomerase/thioredoxin
MIKYSIVPALTLIFVLASNTQAPIKANSSLAFSLPVLAQTGKFAPKVGTIKPAEFSKYKDSAKGKVLVINFWATWCGPCVVEFPEFVAVDKKYRERGVKVVGISSDEIADIKSKVIPFINEQQARFEILVQDTDDPQQIIDIIDKNWSGVLPATFVYDRQGNNILTRYGIIDRDQLVGAIEKALK